MSRVSVAMPQGKISPIMDQSGEMPGPHQEQPKKHFTQQVFHKALFTSKPRSQSLTSIPPQSTANIDLTDESSSKPEENEDGFKEVSYSKKRQRESPETHRNEKQTKLNSYWLSKPIETSNSFSNLEEDVLTPNNQPKEITKPPPIYVDKVSNIQPLIKLLDEHANGSYEIKVLRDEQVKIQPKSSETYSQIVKQLEIKQTEFYTYKPKQDRSFKVVLKNIHPSTDTNEISEELLSLGHTVINIWNIKQRITKKPLPIFIVELHPKSNNKSIYEVGSLLHCRCSFEPPRPKREIPQCANCQQYGHTKRYCHRKPKCIKCAGDHSSFSCERKGRSDNVKCILCDGNHPANYKGCAVYQELQKVKYPPMKTKIPSNPKEPKLISHQNVPSRNTPFRMTYSQAAQINKKEQELPTTETSQTTSETELMLNMLKQLMQQMTTMTNLLINFMSKITQNSIK